MKITPLVASTFYSDGGTMFGLVPKGIWAKRLPPDERNRIPQHAHSLLVELDDGRRGLVDTGCGPAESFSPREIDLHGLGPGWPLRDALHILGLRVEQIDFVAFTHLHWDHAGAARSFPSARFLIHEDEWADACSGNPLLYKSYPPEIVNGLRASEDRITLVTDRENEIAPGFRLIRSSGHTRGHCAAVFEGGPIEIGSWRESDLVVFAGDVCPTQHHLRMVFQTSYDTFPLDTRAWKREWLPRIARENGVLLFDHDPQVFGCSIREDAREEFVTVDSLSA